MKKHSWAEPEDPNGTLFLQKCVDCGAHRIGTGGGFRSLYLPSGVKPTLNSRWQSGAPPCKEKTP